MCVKCSGSGFVVATHKKNGGLYAFRCLCAESRSRGISEKITPWTDRLCREFEPDQFTPEFPDPKKFIINPKEKTEDVPF